MHFVCDDQKGILCKQSRNTALRCSVLNNTFIDFTHGKIEKLIQFIILKIHVLYPNFAYYEFAFFILSNLS